MSRLPISIPELTEAEEAALRARIDARSIPEPNTGCWLWLGAANEKGYSQISLKGRAFFVHRLAFILSGRKITPGMFVCHKCDVPACCNPEHLFLGTAGDNVHDMDRKGRDRRPRGSQLRTAKLTEQDVLEIRNAKETNVALARQYGVSTTAISEARSGRKWAHVKEAA